MCAAKDLAAAASNDGSDERPSAIVAPENHATGAGSAFFADDGARATLTNELYFNNVCARDGGTGIYVDGADNGTGSHVTLINSTIANHACQTGNRASVYVEKNSSITIRNSIIWGNGGKDFQIDSGSTLSLTYSITEENVGGNGVLHSDPRFADPTKDFHLKSTAGRWDPAANSGSGAFVKDGQDSPGIDSGYPGDNVASESAPNGSRVNLGAYGRTPQASLSK